MMSDTYLTCAACAEVRPRLTWQAKAGGGYHLRADCPRCGRYIKFVPQVEPWVEMAGPIVHDDQLPLFGGVSQ